MVIKKEADRLSNLIVEEMIRASQEKQNHRYEVVITLTGK
jgi:hypothetical protein